MFFKGYKNEKKRELLSSFDERGTKLFRVLRQGFCFKAGYKDKKV